MPDIDSARRERNAFVISNEKNDYAVLIAFGVSSSIESGTVVMDVKTFGGHWRSVLVIRGAIALSSFIRCQQCYLRLRHVYITVQYIQPATVRSSLSESVNF